ncbi:MAG: NAD(P)H-dependent glycerol-3-phosphate dehydrogenase [Desulfosarcina sp.]|nr:NAD(P)H-dependent glycerol-3-phosphate dehydrogenase [Desulfobacterales bacterium]
MNLTPDDNLRLGVVGAGSWGTALANLLACKGYELDLWVFETEICKQIEKQRENKIFLPGVTLSANLNPTKDIRTAVADKDLVLAVVPSHVMRDVSGQMGAFLHPDTLLVSASKGIENQTHLTMSGVIRDTLPDWPESQIAVISGPSFAKEVARKAPTVVTAASADLAAAVRVQTIFATPYFRVYTNKDVIGVEIGGAIKNVIAIAAGVIDGLGLGLNTRAALITRGLAEIQRLGRRMGADPRTLAGIAGVGDLLLTCTGDLSRNHTVGKKIGEGLSLDEILAEMRMVAEGVKTAKSVYNLARKLEVEMPICKEMYAILYEGASPREAVYRLMTRDLKQELE